MPDLNRISYWIGGLGLLTCIVVGYQMLSGDSDLGDTFAMTGSIASLFGLLVVIAQISALRQTSELTRQAVIDTKSKLVNSISLSDVSRATQLIQEVQVHAQHGSHSSVWLRLRDLKALLIQFRDLEAMTEVDKDSAYGDIISTIGVEIISLYDVVTGKADDFQPANLNQQLEELAGILNELEGHLKYG